MLGPGLACDRHFFLYEALPQKLSIPSQPPLLFLGHLPSDSLNSLWFWGTTTPLSFYSILSSSGPELKSIFFLGHLVRQKGLPSSREVLRGPFVG